jgi:putative transposase
MNTHLHHHLPHPVSFTAEPLVFFTVVVQDRRALLNTDHAHHVLREIWERSAECNGWFVGDYILMPDHVHLFARASRQSDPIRGWIKMWKSVSSRRLAADGSVWQRDYFDRFLRHGDDYTEKWTHVEANPVRAGLVEHPHDWPYRGRIHRLAY